MDLVAAQSKWVFGYSLASMLLADKKTHSGGALVISFFFLLSDFASRRGPHNCERNVGIPLAGVVSMADSCVSFLRIAPILIYLSRECSRRASTSTQIRREARRRRGGRETVLAVRACDLCGTNGRTDGRAA